MNFARSRLSIAVLLAVCSGSPFAQADGETLTLAEAYRLALRNSDQVALASQQVDAADIRWRDTWSDIRPTLNATAQVTVQREITIGTQVVTPRQTAEFGVLARQPLFRKGFFASRDAGRYGRESVTALLTRAREQLARDVAEAFIHVVGARGVVASSRGAVTRATAQYDHAVGRVKAGNTLKSAELLAQIDVKRAERQLVSARRDLGVAEAAFRRLVGQAAPAVLEFPKLPTPPPPAAAVEAAKQRSDLQALAFQGLESSARVDAARGRRWWPQLDVEASVSYFVPERSNYNVDWRVLGVLTIPLLQSGREATEVALRQNEARIAKLELEQQRKLLNEEVEAGAVLASFASEAAELADLQLKTATEHYALVDKQFRLGAVTFLEVTNATAALAEAELASEIARMDRAQAIFDYLFVIGAIDLEEKSASSR